MRLIKEMADFMMDEVNGAKEYAIMALEYEYTKPQLAELFHKLAQTEMLHFNNLHEQTVKMIEEVKSTDKKIPQKMLDNWDKRHKEMIICQEETQVLINLYR